MKKNFEAEHSRSEELVANTHCGRGRSQDNDPTKGKPKRGQSRKVRRRHTSNTRNRATANMIALCNRKILN